MSVEDERERGGADVGRQAGRDVRQRLPAVDRPVHDGLLVGAGQQRLAVGVAEVDADEVGVLDVAERLERLAAVLGLEHAAAVVDAALPEPPGVGRVEDDRRRTVGDRRRAPALAKVRPLVVAALVTNRP